VFVILNNREYRILKHNMDTYRQRFGAGPERGFSHMDLVAPHLRFVALARGLSADAACVNKPNERNSRSRSALGARRPFLPDVTMEGRA
jgi:benzoylformate decarboxylase